MERERKKSLLFFCTLSFIQECRGWVRVWWERECFGETIASLFCDSKKKDIYFTSNAFLVLWPKFQKLVDKKKQGPNLPAVIMNRAIYIVSSLSCSKWFHVLSINDLYFSWMAKKCKFRESSGSEVESLPVF